MGEVLYGPDGIKVKAITLTGGEWIVAVLRGNAPEDDRGEQYFKVTRDGALVGYYPDTETLGRVVDLSTLRPES